jgi:hypothetical protein
VAGKIRCSGAHRAAVAARCIDSLWQPAVRVVEASSGTGKQD